MPNRWVEDLMPELVDDNTQTRRATFQETLDQRSVEEADLSRRVTMATLLASVESLVSIPHIYLFGLVDWRPMVITVLAVLGWGLSILVNLRGHYTAARAMVFGTTLAAYVPLSLLLGHDSGFQVIAFILPPMVLLLARVHERRFLLWGIALPGVLFILVTIAPFEPLDLGGMAPVLNVSLAIAAFATIGTLLYGAAAINRETIYALVALLDIARRERDARREADLAKSRFLATMSHELRTPLNAVLGYADMVREELEDAEDVDPQARRDVQRIHQAGSHLLGLINSVLDLTKIEAGKHTVRVTSFDLGALLADVADTLRGLAEAGGNTLEATADDVGAVHADREKLRQVLVNLAGNAIKFTEHGAIALRAHREENQLVIEVEDTGIGIPPEVLPRIFEAFEQADSSFTRLYEGTGLGLTLCRELVQLMGGRIAATSEEGRGSVFRVTVPDRGVAAPLAPSGAVRGRALVIDDDPTTRELVHRWLQPEGWQVETCADGEQGWRALQADELPSVVILDVLLPRVDGWTLLDRARADERLRDLPIVMVSVEDETEQGLARGADHFLVKPLTREALRAAV